MSFIIPFYELPVELLRQCVESIMALSLSPHEREIIVVDDGSTLSPITALADLLPQIVYLRQANGGLSAARNMGIRVAAGDYLQFVDADDRLLTTAYEHCLDLVRYERPDMVLFAHTDRPPTTTTATFEDLPTVSGPELLRTRNIRGSACGYLFRRAMLGELRFTPGTLHEDEEFTPLLLLRADSVRQSSAQAYLYSQRDGSIMAEESLRHRIRRLADMQSILLRLQRTADTMPADGRTALRRRISQLTMDYIYNIIRLTGSRHYLDRKLNQLRRAGLYPLPKRNYTRKYTWFRRLANSEVGLSMLMRTIPLLKKEQ